MRRLVFVTMVACVATLATGCIISSDDDDLPPDDFGQITADWSFHNAAADNSGGTEGPELGCPAGFDTTAVTATPVGGGQPIVDLYDCVALTGTSDYPLDSYDVHMDITTHGGGTAYNAGSLENLDVDITSADQSVSEDFVDNGGRFVLDWVLVDAGNQTTSCAAAGAVKIGITGTLAGVGPYADDLPCGDASGISVAALAGTYTLTIQALDGSGAALGAGTTLTNKTLLAPNGYLDLGSVSVPFN